MALNLLDEQRNTQKRRDMSQNRHKQTSGHTVNSYLPKTIGFYLLLICLASILVFGNASASVPNSTQTAAAPGQILKSSLLDLSTRKTAELDWRTQSFELNFDLPAHDWYDKLDLFLSAYPQGNVARGTPLLISYNGAQPVPLYGRASRFDAHIRMDTSRIRLTGNTIKITYKTPTGSSCLTPGNGKWVLDLSRSKLVASVRPKKRALQIVEIEQRLAHPMTAPKRVGIQAIGKNKLAYEALSAQGVAQRMDFVPEFKLGSGVTDMVVLVGTYTDLAPWLNNKAIQHTKGTKVLIDSGSKPRLVLAGETEEQVLELVRAFASHHLPNLRRNDVFLQDLYTSAKLTARTIIDTGDYKLSHIGTPALAHSWQADPAIVKFNVADPNSASAVLTLNIFNAKDINPKSRLSLDLNGQAIGYTYLNKSSKKIEFKIKPGMFVPTNNRLSFTPELLPDDKLTVCGAQQNIPTVLISSHSSFKLKTDNPMPDTDLSRFAATGAPFDKNAVIVMSGKSLKDRQASLQFLAFAAKRFGPKWTDADYVAKLPVSGISDKNILFIGPDPISDPALFNAAPGGLKLALHKKRIVHQTGNIAMKPKQFASSDEAQIIKIMAAQTPSRLSTAKLKPGGLAALFPSPYASRRVIGLISSDRKLGFSSAMDRISHEDTWNALRGSVVRWDDTSILMTQTTIAHTGLRNGQINPDANTAKPSGVVANIKNRFASLSFGKGNSTENVLNNSGNDIPATIPHGELPAKFDNQNSAAKPTGWVASRSNLSETITPAVTSLKTASIQAKQDLVAWWQGTSVTTFENTSLQKWWKALVQNPKASLLLLAFLAFFLTALCSPMTSRGKKS